MRCGRRRWRRATTHRGQNIYTSISLSGGGGAGGGGARVSYVLLRRGSLYLSSTLDAAGTAMAPAAESLLLDDHELEAASAA